MILFYALVSCLQANETDHDFVYHSSEKLQKVNIAGSFNGWNKDSDPMTPSADGTTWTKHFKLKPGSYTYKFVLNGDRWILDPMAARNVDDGNGNTNSQLLIAPAGYEKPAKVGDGIITARALKHLTEVPFFNYDRGKLTLSLQARPNDIASLKVDIDGIGIFPLADEGGDEFFERYAAHVPWDRKHDVRYRFVLNDGNGSHVFGPKGLTISGIGNSFVVKASTFQPFVVPSWVEHSVIYHIFPDRFAKGDVSNPPSNLVPWGSTPNYFSYQGGNIAGIEQHLGYLKDLGISTVFFNPIFKSPSYHRYETADYHLIDPIFGTNQEFKQLTHEMKQVGMRVMLDGVFNHTATSFLPFADVVKNGAGSKYTGWYTFRSFPVKIGENPNYVAWFNYPSMPKVNYDSQEATDYMLGVPKFWNQNADISAWRLDAANEVTPEYWKKFRTTVKALNKDMWIVGEVWGDGSPWLKGDQWDSVMNYQFRAGVLDFVTPKGSGKPSVLLNKLMDFYNSYAPQVSRNMMNLIGSHDTARILTVCEGDAGLAKLAAIIQFTWVGAPSVYYGDELGMQGGVDPDNRRVMSWDTATHDNSFLQLYKKLIKVRNSDLVLQSGDPLPILADDAKQVAAFARVLGDKADIVAINRSNDPQTIDLNLSTVAGLPKSTVAVSFSDALSGETLSPSKSILHLRLAPRSAAVLIPHSGNSSHFSLSRHAIAGGSSAMSSNHSPKEPH